MSSLNWPIAPSDFPQFFLVGSVTGGPDDATIRTQVSQGRERTRSKYAKPTKRFNGALLFPSQAAFAAFETFFETTLSNGTAEFDWVHPSKPLTAATLRFVGPYSAQPVTDTIIRVTVTVEILPS